MDSIEIIRKEFKKIVSLSLTPDQVNHLGQKVDGRFDLYRVSGLSYRVPIPRLTAANILTDYFRKEQHLVLLFEKLLEIDGSKLSGATISVPNVDKFITLLEKYKWVYNEYLGTFHRDPFYEHEINFLNSLRVLDLRENVDTKKIIKEIEKNSKQMRMSDLEWRITVRMYDLTPDRGKLIKSIIELLLGKQNMGQYSNELFVCFKELAINSSKANYKLLYEKYVTAPEGITSTKNYRVFLQNFKDEIAENGIGNLIKYAEKDDMFFNVSFQSSEDAIAIWVSNYSNISRIEKQRLLKKIQVSDFESLLNDDGEDDFSEGAGFGISLILNILRKYTHEKDPLKVLFYSDFIKIGFMIKREDLLSHEPESEEE